MGREGRKSPVGILGWGLGRGLADRRVRVVGGAGQGKKHSCAILAGDARGLCATNVG